MGIDKEKARNVAKGKHKENERGLDFEETVDFTGSLNVQANNFPFAYTRRIKTFI